MTNLSPADTLTIGTARFPANPTPTVGIVRTAPAERLARRHGAREALRSVLTEAAGMAPDAAGGVRSAVGSVAGRLGLNLTEVPE